MVITFTMRLHTSKYAYRIGSKSKRYIYMYVYFCSYQCATPGKRFKNEDGSFDLNQPVKCQENETWSLSAESLASLSDECDCKLFERND